MWRRPWHEVDMLFCLDRNMASFFLSVPWKEKWDKSERSGGGWSTAKQWRQTQISYDKLRHNRWEWCKKCLQNHRAFNHVWKVARNDSPKWFHTYAFLRTNHLIILCLLERIQYSCIKEKSYHESFRIWLPKLFILIRQHSNVSQYKDKWNSI